MGFPRVISKSNKIYTKLGEFCLSGDGMSFWILCQTCQQELQTQDQFWKHIQDEHNFMHGFSKHEVDSGGAPILPLPLYRKLNEEEQEEESQEQQERKNYTDMRTIEMDIKVEPQVQPAPTVVGHASHAVELSGAHAQLPQVPPVSAYAALVQQHAAAVTPNVMGHMPTANTVAVGAGAGAVPPQLLPQELPKDSNSTTASAGSAAVSSDDGERWYICDYETCGLKFKYQSRLELHRSVHSKERRFACELCGASFKQSCNLSTHRKKKHFLKGSKGGLVQQRF